MLELFNSKQKAEAHLRFAVITSSSFGFGAAATSRFHCVVPGSLEQDEGK